MKILERNKQEFYYALYQSTGMVISSKGYKTGEPIPEYGEPIYMKASISPATGKAVAEMFGTNTNYSKVIITDDMDCPIDEHSVLWVETVPVLDTQGKTITPNDYIVTEISKSLNCIAYAIAKVNKGTTVTGT